MKNFLIKHPAMVLNITTLLLIAYIYLTKAHFQFLIVNLALALIPFNLSLLTKNIPSKPYLHIPLFLIWLVFYPNTIYMLTDFSHLSSIGTGLANSFQYFNYSILTVSIILALLLGLLSMESILNMLTRSAGLKILGYIILSILAAFAIYFGRFLRLNSSDLFFKPTETINTILAANSNELLNFVSYFSLMQLFLIFIYQFALIYCKREYI
ncbi:DUF1361 domain-containing protein [Weissella oryzae]|uniref:DUF1361 domain-containing protein n=1 Tax=Weissella oryzae TaxID=1129792 RepID=UPI00048717C4|nr:DUF1361 domain-containing protein [Weissella oryzae]